MMKIWLKLNCVIQKTKWEFAVKISTNIKGLTETFTDVAFEPEVAQ